MAGYSPWGRKVSDATEHVHERWQNNDLVPDSVPITSCLPAFLPSFLSLSKNKSLSLVLQQCSRPFFLELMMEAHSNLTLL